MDTGDEVTEDDVFDWSSHKEEEWPVQVNVAKIHMTVPVTYKRTWRGFDIEKWGRESTSIETRMEVDTKTLDTIRKQIEDNLLDTVILKHIWFDEFKGEYNVTKDDNKEQVCKLEWNLIVCIPFKCPEEVLWEDLIEFVVDNEDLQVAIEKSPRISERRSLENWIPDTGVLFKSLVTHTYA